MRKRPRLRFLIAAAIAAGLATLNLGAGGNAQPAKTTIQLGLLKIAGLADAYAADKLGYFAEQGLEVNVTLASSGQDLLAAVQSGKLDIVLAIPGTAMQAREKGFKVQLVLQNETSNAKAPDQAALLVKPDSPITSIKQLVGKKIAYNAIGNQSWASVRYLMLRNGVDPNSVQDLELSIPQMPGALEQGLVDAIAIVEPFMSATVAAKKGRVLSWNFVESVPNQPTGAFWATDEYIAKNPATIKKFVNAMHKSITYLTAHMDERHKMVVEWTGMKPEVVQNTIPNPWNDKVNRKDWERTIDMLVKGGSLKAPMKFEEIVPPSALNPGGR
jgi:NitT/TauT family transport system substrate-binding protein